MGESESRNNKLIFLNLFAVWSLIRDGGGVGGGFCVGGEWRSRNQKTPLMVDIAEGDIDDDMNMIV
jgi:hypothetical protein